VAAEAEMGWRGVDVVSWYGDMGDAAPALTSAATWMVEWMGPKGCQRMRSMLVELYTAVWEARRLLKGGSGVVDDMLTRFGGAERPA